MATYYVDSVNGNDSWNGLYPEYQGGSDGPWKTISKVSGSSFSPGDEILFRSGQTFFSSSTLNLTSSGSSSQPIRYSSYGQYSPPVIIVATVITSWSNHTVQGVYKANLASTPYICFEDGVMLRRASSDACSDGNWYFASSTLYYRPTDNSNPYSHFVYASPSVACRFNSSKSYITFENIAFNNCYISFYFDAVCSNIIVRNCVFSRCIYGIHFSTSGGLSNGTIEGNKFQYCVRNLNLVTSSTYLVSNTTVQNNEIKYAGYVDTQNSIEPFLYSPITPSGIVIQNCENVVIQKNVVVNVYDSSTGTGKAISIAPTSTSYANNLTIRHNKIKNVRGNGIYINPSASNIITNLAVYNNILCGCNTIGSAAIYASRACSSTDPAYIYNNTVLESDHGIYFVSTANYFNFRNNIFSIVENGYAVNTAASSVLSNTFDYNLYDSANTTPFRIGTTDYTFSDWRAATNQDGNSVLGSPSFLEPKQEMEGRISRQSLAIDKGTSITGRTIDFYNNPVPMGSAPDIGCHEFDPNFYYQSPITVTHTKKAIDLGNIMFGKSNVSVPVKKLIWSPTGTSPQVTVKDAYGNVVFSASSGRKEAEFRSLRGLVIEKDALQDGTLQIILRR